jgi:ferric reductase like protein
MSAQLTWDAARAAGIVAWALAAAAVLWGLALSTRALGAKPKPPWLFDLHRFLGGAALIFTGVHVGAILLDTYVHFGLVEVLVPLTGTWHPAAVAWGIVSLYLLLAVELTSLARRRLSKRLWRRVHVGSFALFVISTIHGLTAGTDRGSPVLVGAMVAVTAAVIGLTVERILQASRPAPTPVTRPRSRPARPAPARPDVELAGTGS